MIGSHSGSEGKPGRRGRRPGRPDTKSVILDAARKAFAAEGYDGTSIRQIAEAAHVDTALVHHYFGTKDDLFNATIDFPTSPAAIKHEIADGPIESIGARVAETFLRRWDDPVSGPALEALMRRALASRQVSKLVREFFAVQIVRQIGPILGQVVPVDEIPIRTSLTLSHLFGLAVARKLLKIEPLASIPHDQLVATIAPALQRYLTGALPSGN